MTPREVVSWAVAAVIILFLVLVAFMLFNEIDEEDNESGYVAPYALEIAA